MHRSISKFQNKVYSYQRKHKLFPKAMLELLILCQHQLNWLFPMWPVHRVFGLVYVRLLSFDWTQQMLQNQILLLGIHPLIWRKKFISFLHFFRKVGDKDKVRRITSITMHSFNIVRWLLRHFCPFSGLFHFFYLLYVSAFNLFLSISLVAYHGIPFVFHMHIYVRQSTKWVRN